MATKYIRSVGPQDLAMGTNDTQHCERWGLDCKPSISWDNRRKLRIYQLSDGAEVLVCRKACAEVLDHVFDTDGR